MVGGYGSYIHAVMGSRTIRVISHREANEILSRVEDLTSVCPDGAGHYLVNKAFVFTGMACSGQDGPEVVVLYNHDNEYRLVVVHVKALAETFQDRPLLLERLREFDFSFYVDQSSRLQD
jgi:hypothetical protein